MSYLQSRYLLQAVLPEQRTLWDAFVQEHPQGHLLQSWHWGELKAYSSWQPLRLAYRRGQYSTGHRLISVKPFLRSFITICANRVRWHCV
jgi:lipid II:glycine glycyltransferase (peptidoglycan interpeptide bridge formation enzyme)